MLASRRPSLHSPYTRSKRIVVACPPPMHAEPMAYRFCRRCSVCTRLAVMRAPDAASGWPRAAGGRVDVSLETWKGEGGGRGAYR